MKLSLVVGQGSHKGRAIPVPAAARFMIGRSSDCNLRPASQAISKRHCVVLQRGDKAFVQDLGSTNGTFVNDEQVQGERELQDGDILKVGPLDFRVAVAVEEVQAEKPTQVEKATQKVAPQKAPPPPAAQSTDALDEDSIGSMLLELGDEDKVSGPLNEDSISGGSTIMEFLTPKKEGGSPSAPYRPTSKPAADAKTADAAKAILEKYRRRPRA
jgi:predicted component of type VI protein secretion system